MTDSPEVLAARIEAGRARARFLASVRAFEAPILDLKRQLTPGHIMGGAWDAAKSKGADLAEDAVDAVRARPLAATGVVAAITMFLAREPLIDLAGKLASGVTGKRKAARKPAPPKAPRARTTRRKPTTTEAVE
jgi:hypothetical protein